MSGIVLKARNIKKSFMMGKSTLNVLSGIDLDIYEGSILAIVGESGAGKSTLLHILGMLDRPSEGSLSINGADLIGKSDGELAVYRNKYVGFIFQFHHLLPEFNALENVQMPALINGKFNKESRDRAAFLLEKVGLTERLKHRPGELSGGELQRVAVARALMNEPSIIFADEPSGNLDHKNSEMLHNLIWDLASEQNSSFVIVTHDIELAKRADRVVKMTDGMLDEMIIEKNSEHLLY